MNGPALDTLKAQAVADELAPRFADALWAIVNHGRGFSGPFGYLVESVLTDKGLITRRHGPATPLGHAVAKIVAPTPMVRGVS